MRLPMRVIWLSVTVYVLAFGCLSANAQIREIGTYGAWTVYGGKSNQGNAMCGSAVYNNDRSRSFHIKHFITEKVITVHVFKNTWKIPEETPISVTIKIDDRSPWLARAHGYGNRIEWTIGSNSVKLFLTEFMEGLQMRLSFPDGNEADWTASLTGSTAALSVFLRCVETISAPSQNTQPFSRPETQPFGTPTQPHNPPANPSQNTPRTRNW